MCAKRTNKLEKLIESAQLQAANQKEFVEYFEGQTLEDAFGFVKKCEIDNTKHVFVVSIKMQNYCVASV